MDRHIRHAIQTRFGWTCGSLGSFLSSSNLHAINAVQLLIHLQQATLQPCSCHGCEVWAVAGAAFDPMQALQQL